MYFWREPTAALATLKQFAKSLSDAKGSILFTVFCKVIFEIYSYLLLHKMCVQSGALLVTVQL